MNEGRPDFFAFSDIEERLLSSKLESVRQVISHAGEKGRSLEGEVITWLRSFLPNEYGLSTGFVVHQGSNGPEISSQLDIIIYDAIRSGPISHLSTCDVFPLEAVYGYVEVKASLRSCLSKIKHWPEDSIESCIDKNKVLRSMKDRRVMAPGGTTTSAVELLLPDPPSVRAYVLAFSAQGTVAKDAKQFAQRMANYLAEVKDAHLHGVLIAGAALFVTRPVDTRLTTPESYNVLYTSAHPLAAFKWNLLHDLGRYPRIPVNCVPAIDRYRPKTVYSLCVPQKQKPKLAK